MVGNAPRLAAGLTIQALAALLVGCSGGSGGDDPAPPSPPAADTTPPTVPGGVTAVAQSSTEILVSWTASTDASGISGYRVFRDGAATAVATVQTTSYTDPGRTAGVTYSYAVSAVDAATPPNVSAPSAAATRCRA